MKETLKLALEALEGYESCIDGYYAGAVCPQIDKAITAIKEALAQPEQEPVAWLEPEWGEKICPEVGYEVTMINDHPRDLCWIPLYPHPPQGELVAYLVLFEGAGKLLEFKKGNYIHGAKVEHIPLYTTPPQRTWVGLTDEEIDRYFDEKWGGYSSYHDCFKEVMRWQEAKLKEKK
jgi:hypothetical protein